MNPASNQEQESIRFITSLKQQEKGLLKVRDDLAEHYRLNKSDLVKYLIRKEHNNLKREQFYLEHGYDAGDWHDEIKLKSCNGKLFRFDE